MKKCVFPLLTLLAAASLMAPRAASAQGVYFGAGATFPTGDYGDYAKTGYIGVAGVSFSVGPDGLSIVGEGFFGQNSHSDVSGDKTYPYGGMAGLLYDLTPQEDGGIYFFGQLGAMVHKYSSDEFEGESETGFGFGGGAGYGIPLGGGTEIFLEGRYMRGNFDYGNTSFFGLVGGVALTLGGGD
jgi:hypothetical protein